MIAQNYLNVAVVGCGHGELDAMYERIFECRRQGQQVDLLIVCGDFQCVRNYNDFEGVAVPKKYRHVKSFQQYVDGSKIAPVMTIFIGGNHEASHILQTLYYGGFVAPNIYFLGFAGVVWYGGIRIAGLSGIYNKRHYKIGHYERPPYSSDTLRSIYHLRELEVYRMTHLSQSKGKIDVFLSHDWPQYIWEYGDKEKLLRYKSFLQENMQSGEMGSPPAMTLLRQLKPSFWFAGHMHVRFEASVPHTSDPNVSSTGKKKSYKTFSEKTRSISSADIQSISSSSTYFLSLDKVVPNR
jgi:lariat debranching enzyme